MANITLAPSGLADGDLILPDFTQKVEFKLHTAAAELVSVPERGNPIVRAVGSSTIRDRQGDTMEYSALQDMQKAQPGLAIFVNHSYNVPDDLVGKLADYPAAVLQRDIADLHLAIELLTEQFPRADALYKAIQSGVKMGISIGCMITAAEWRDMTGKAVDESHLDLWDVIEGRVHLHVLGVDALEWSFVGIPANQRSWVQYAAQGLFRRSLRDEAPDERLAALVRTWFPDDFQRDISAVKDKSARTLLAHVQPRNTDRTSIVWRPATKDFALMSDHGKRRQTLERDQVADLLAGSAPEATKSADDADKQAQEARAQKYGIGIKEGGHVTKPSKWEDVPDAEWGDPVNYKMPLPDKAHADNAASRWGDEDNRTGYTAAEQTIISDRIAARQAHFGEKKDDKGMDLTVTKAVTVASDGTHAAYTGTHTHAHTSNGEQGDDAMHEHDHTHADDANHGHPHEKDVVPDVTAAAPTPVATDVPVVTASVDASTVAMLTAYNTIGKQLGFPAHALTTKCNLVDDSADAQRVISIVSELDRDFDLFSAALSGVNIGTIAHNVDVLMALLGIPDPDNDMEPRPYTELDAGQTGTMMPYALTPRTRKSGARNSKDDQAHIQSVHDHACALGASCTQAQDAPAESPQAARDYLDDQKAVLPDILKALDGLTSALAGFHLPAIQEQVAAAQTQADAATAALTAVQAQITAQAAKAAALADANAAAQSKLDTLTTTALGRPTTAGMPSKQDDPAAAHPDIIAPALDLTSGLERRYIAGIGHVVIWPDGHRKDQRPDLTPLQARVMTEMSGGIENLYAYREGRACMVPLV